MLVEVIDVLDDAVLHRSADADEVEHREVLHVLAEADAAGVWTNRDAELRGEQQHGDHLVHAAEPAGIDRRRAAMTATATPSRTTMRAAVLVDVARIEVRDVPVQPPAPHEVLVRVEAVGLCGTDLHIVAGHANYNTDAHGHVLPLSVAPQILGHEIAGVIEQVGSAVVDAKPGDRVIVDQGRTCVSERRAVVCEYCRSGDSHQCEHYAEHGITGLPGGFAELVTVPAANTVRVTSDLPAEHAALAEPLGCIVHSSEMISRAGARYPLGRRGEAHGLQGLVAHRLHDRLGQGVLDDKEVRVLDLERGERMATSPRDGSKN